MGLLRESERDFVTAVSHLAYVNPFLPERIDWERRALGEEHLPFDSVWHARGDPAGENPNEVRIAERSAALAEELRERLGGGARALSGPRPLSPLLPLPGSALRGADGGEAAAGLRLLRRVRRRLGALP